MKTNYTEEQKYIRAKKKVENIKGFYANILSYIIVIPFLAIINLKFSPEFHWFWFPAAGWGIGLIFHAFGVYGYDFIFGKDWEDRKIKEYMDKYDDKL
jgi:hypothetical protein